MKMPEFFGIGAESFDKSSLLLIAPIYTPEYGDVVSVVSPVYRADGTYLVLSVCPCCRQVCSAMICIRAFSIMGSPGICSG